MRNDLLHYGVSSLNAENNRVIVTNELFAHVERRIRYMHLTRDNFFDLFNDLIDIYNRLNHLLNEDAASSPYPPRVAW